MYDEIKSAPRIADELNLHRTSVYRVLRRNGIVFKKQAGKNHSNWKGGRGLKAGYWTVYSKNHPRKLNNGRVFEHILIAEKKTGRLIDKSEPIHHIDFDRKNNCPDNLFVCENHSQHRQIHNSLEGVARELFNKGLIVFDGEKYKLGNAVTTNVIKAIMEKLIK